jgi:hypothetical protein
MVKKKVGDSELTGMISMRLTAEDEQFLDSVAALVPVAPRLALARVALRLGLEQIRQNPARALAPQGRTKPKVAQ